AQKALLQLQAHQENGFAEKDLATIIQYIEQ
ncbi:NAD(P)-dependent oxidoreductase, partial [Acinetobacter johnsonii]